MYNSTLARIIDEAINDCITYGSGQGIAHMETGGGRVGTVSVVTSWADDEESIEVAIYENQVLRFSYIERIPEEYR